MSKSAEKIHSKQAESFIKKRLEGKNIHREAKKKSNAQKTHWECPKPSPNRWQRFTHLLNPPVRWLYPQATWTRDRCQLELEGDDILRLQSRPLEKHLLFVGFFWVENQSDPFECSCDFFFWKPPKKKTTWKPLYNFLLQRLLLFDKILSSKTYYWWAKILTKAVCSFSYSSCFDIFHRYGPLKPTTINNSDHPTTQPAASPPPPRPRTQVLPIASERWIHDSSSLTSTHAAAWDCRGWAPPFRTCETWRFDRKSSTKKKKVSDHQERWSEKKGLYVIIRLLVGREVALGELMGWGKKWCMLV